MLHALRSSDRAFGTVITRNYLPYARALARSIRRFHDEPMYVVCVDEPDGFFDRASEPFTLLTANDLLPKEHRQLLFYYTPFEACNALRAYLHHYICTHTTHERWIYLDSDIYVTASLEPVFAAMDAPCTGLISPHCTQPSPAALMEPVETSLQKFGIYNSGFLALRRSDETKAFVAWFVERLRTLCFAMHRGVNVDQLWLNFVPEYFPSMPSWKHPGANVAYWNLHERRLTRGEGGYLSNGEQLLFVHFSRWRYENPDDWSFGRPLAQDTDRDVIRDLGIEYRDALQGCGYESSRSWGYGYAAFANGRPITTAMRRKYYDLLLTGQAPVGNPFEHPEWFPRKLDLSWIRRLIPQGLKTTMRELVS